MKILIACEYSGIVRDAFTAKGHDAWSCDILPTETKGNHIQGNVLDYLNKGWDMMIAHPPCTYLSNAGSRWLFKNKLLNQKRYKKGLEAKAFFLTLLEANIYKICVENPTPIKIFNLPKSSTSVQPYEFGHPFSKKTLLWLKNLPPLISTNIVSKYETFLPSNTGFGKRKGHKHNIKKIPKNYNKEHSKFWTGIAEAMADQWG
tara:strand:- start:100 stop:708 length:609 start_codon:yes stop_codon:yes gene_type:complete